MIVFDLACACGYQFEGWFQGHDDYEKQCRSGLLVCPVCNGRDIRKILSPVTVRSSRGIYMPEGAPDNSEDKVALELLRGLQNYVKKNFEDVGAKLAEEVLKIHYGVEKPRNIRGVATEQEEKMLAEEGIELTKIPLQSDDEDLN